MTSVPAGELEEQPRIASVSAQWEKVCELRADEIAVIEAASPAKKQKVTEEERGEEWGTFAADSRQHPPSGLKVQGVRSFKVPAGDTHFTYQELRAAVAELAQELRCCLRATCELAQAGGQRVGGPWEEALPFPPAAEGKRSPATPLVAPELPSRGPQARCPPILLLLEPSADYVIAVLACFAAGVAFVPLDQSWPFQRQAAVAAQSGARLLICTEAAIGPGGPLAKIASHPQRHAALTLSRSLICHAGFRVGGEGGRGQARGPEEGIGGQARVGSAAELALGSPSAETSDIGKGRAGALESGGGPRRGEDSAACYVLYTSGSTGQPKGVCGTQRGLLNRLHWMAQHYPYGPREVACFKTAQGFIDHLTELLGPLLAGAPLLIPPPSELRANPCSLLRYLQGYRVTRLVATPALLQLLLPRLEQRPSPGRALQILACSGDHLHVPTWQRLQRALPTTTILNLYGSTEVSGDCMWFDTTAIRHLASRESTPGSQPPRDDGSRETAPACPPMPSCVPIGRPIPGCWAGLLDVATGRLLTPLHGASTEGCAGPGAAPLQGELCIAGVGNFAGYLGDPEGTAAKLQPIPEARAPAAAGGESRGSSQGLRDRMGGSDEGREGGCDPGQQQPRSVLFKTGDLARLLPDGTFVLVGRLDRCVNIHGHRIELGEVEAALLEHPHVRHAAALLQPLQTGNGRDVQLAAYVELEDESHAPAASGSIAEAAPSAQRAPAAVPGSPPGEGSPLPGLSAAAATCWSIGSGWAEGGEELLELRRWVAERLPPAMVPSVLAQMEDMPRTASGKIDYGRLPRPPTGLPGGPSPRRHPLLPAEAREGGSGAAATESCSAGDPEAAELLQRTREVFGRALGQPPLPAAANFLLAGATSLHVAQVAFELGVAMDWLYSHPTPLAVRDLLLVQLAAAGGAGERGSYDLQEAPPAKRQRRDLGKGAGVGLHTKAGHLSLPPALPHGHTTAGRPIGLMEEQVRPHGEAGGREGAAEEPAQPQLAEPPAGSGALQGCSLVTVTKGGRVMAVGPAMAALRGRPPQPRGRGPPAERPGGESERGRGRQGKVEGTGPWEELQQQRGRSEMEPGSEGVGGKREEGWTGVREEQPLAEGAQALRPQWTVRLGSCVDASPLLVWVDGTWRCVIGSHAHNVICTSLRGEVLWEAHLGARIESTATATLDGSQVVVGCYDGRISFLSLHSGATIWAFQTGDQVKGQAVVDPLQGHVWCGSHDGHLYALDPQLQRCVLRHPCGGSVFGAPALDPGRRRVYAAATSGVITALASEPEGVWTECWRRATGAPIFGSPAVVPTSGLVVYGAVDGAVGALAPDGQLAWKVQTGGPVFGGPCLSPALPGQVLVGGQEGALLALCPWDGHLLWKHSVGAPVAGSPAVDLCLSPHSAEPSAIQPDAQEAATAASRHARVAVCCISGMLHVFRVQRHVGHSCGRATWEAAPAGPHSATGGQEAAGPAEKKACEGRGFGSPPLAIAPTAVPPPLPRGRVPGVGRSNELLVHRSSRAELAAEGVEEGAALEREHTATVPSQPQEPPASVSTPPPHCPSVGGGNSLAPGGRTASQARAEEQTGQRPLKGASGVRGRHAVIGADSTGHGEVRCLLDEEKGKRIACELGRMQLGGEVFSSPVMVNGRIFLGCRDDHLYCIEVVQSRQ